MAISKEDRKCLDWAVRRFLAEQVLSTGILQESDKKLILENIKNNLTYEQALNLAVNTKRDNMYLEAELLESVAMFRIIDFLDPAAKLALMESKEEKPEQPEKPEFDLNTAAGKYGLLESILNEAGKTSYRGQLYGRGAATAWKETAKTMGRDIAAGRKTFTNKLKDYAGNVRIFAKRNPELTNVGKWAAAGIGAALAAMFIYKKIYSKQGTKCLKLKGDALQRCIAGVEVASINQTLQALKQAKAKCSTAKNPESCNSKYEKQIAKYEKKLAGHKAAAK